MTPIIPQTQAYTITYECTTHQYVVRAHGFVIDHEWNQYQADIAGEAWQAVYDDARACKIAWCMTGVAAIAAEIARLTQGAPLVWHITSLPNCDPTPGTRYAAIILGTTVELWALSSDARLATLECVFVDVPLLPARTSVQMCMEAA